MTCLHPIHIRMNRGLADTLRHQNDNSFGVPCGKCINCRIAKRAEWALRCTLELETWKQKAVFVTLTYDDDNLPKDESLSKKELQDFIKRFRFEYGEKIKYFACGEYGDTTHRPHYHLIIYGVDIDDEIFHHRYFIPKNGSYNCQCDSWKKGLTNVGTVTYDSIQYVTGYVEKKLFGDKVQEVYGDRQQPFQVQSNGIGKDYFESHMEQVISQGGFWLHGSFRQIPRYYFRKYGLEESIDKQNELNNKVQERINFTDEVGIPWWIQNEQIEKNLKAQQIIRQKGVI